MSLVGPRPLSTLYLTRYSSEQARRLVVVLVLCASIYPAYLSTVRISPFFLSYYNALLGPLGDAEAAGMVIPYHTAHLALFERAGLASGERLLVISGASGVGSAAIQLGAAAGAHVYATAGGPEKVALCREMGAELAVDHLVVNVVVVGLITHLLVFLREVLLLRREGEREG